MTTAVGCPSSSTFECDYCRGLSCSHCHRRSTCDSDLVEIKTIGHYCCEALTCMEANAVATGSSVNFTRSRHAGLRRPHPGWSVTTAQLAQLHLLGTAEAREEARVALDASTSPQRRLRALDRCARILGLDDDARGPVQVRTRQGGDVGDLPSVSVRHTLTASAWTLSTLPVNPSDA